MDLTDLEDPSYPVCFLSKQFVAVYEEKDKMFRSYMYFVILALLSNWCLFQVALPPKHSYHFDKLFKKRMSLYYFFFRKSFRHGFF